MEDEGLSFDKPVPRVRGKWSSPPTLPCPPATIDSDAGLMEEHLGPLRDGLGSRTNS